MKPTRRSSYMVKKKFQSSFAWRFAGLVALEAALMTALFLWISRGTVTTSYTGSELFIEGTGRHFLASFVVIGFVSAAAIAIVALATFVILTHRIAGPVHRIEEGLVEMRGGNLLHRIRLRRKDELGDLAAEVNRLSELLDSRIGDIKKEARRAASSKDAAETAEALRRLQALADAFKTS